MSSSSRSRNTEFASIDTRDPVRLSDSGRLSISIEDLAKTESFKTDLKVLKKIESLLTRKPMARAR